VVFYSSYLTRKFRHLEQESYIEVSGSPEANVSTIMQHLGL